MRSLCTEFKWRRSRTTSAPHSVQRERGRGTAFVLGPLGTALVCGPLCVFFWKEFGHELVNLLITKTIKMCFLQVISIPAVILSPENTYFNWYLYMLLLPIAANQISWKICFICYRKSLPLVKINWEIKKKCWCLVSALSAAAVPENRKIIPLCTYSEK